MSIYQSKEFWELVNHLKNDKKLNSIKNPYDRMRMLVKRNRSKLRKFGDFILEKCINYSTAHSKSMVIAEYCLDHAKLVTQKFDQGNEFGKMEYNYLMTTWNQALRYLPIDWEHWPTLLILMRLYLNRARIHFDCGQNMKALSDLRHASSVLRYYNNPEMVLDHFDTSDQSLLVLMLSLKTKLLLEITDCDASESKNGNRPPFHQMIYQVIESHRISSLQDIESLKLQTRKDIKNALDIINILDSIEDEYNQFMLLKDPIEHQVAKINYVQSNKIQLTQSSSLNHDYGRYYVANKKIEKKETLLLERAFSLVFFKDYFHSFCNYCHKMLHTFWPCANCTEVVFCSVKCSILATNEYHRDECCILGLMLDKLESCFYSLAHIYRNWSKFGLNLALQFEQNAQSERTKCDNTNQRKYEDQLNFDPINHYLGSSNILTKMFKEQSQQDKQVMYQTFTSLLSHRGKRADIHEALVTGMAVALVHFLIYKGKLKKSTLDNIEQYSRLLENVAIAINRIHTNGFAWATDSTVLVNNPNQINNNNSESEVVKVASCVFLISCFFNHSCYPNADWEITHNGTIFFTTNRSIGPGEQLTICYGPKKNMDFEKRQSRLYDDYCFFCHCVVCMKDAANLGNTLKCPNTNCLGPVVMNKYQACLLCGHKIGNKTGDFLNKIANQSFEKFIQIYQELYNNQNSKKKISLVTFYNWVRGLAKNNVLKRYRQQREKEEQKEEQEEEDSFVRLQNMVIPLNIEPNLVIEMNRAQITNKRLIKLEKHLNLSAGVIFGASYHLLEKCTLLLKVYSSSSINFLLIKHCFIRFTTRQNFMNKVTT